MSVNHRLIRNNENFKGLDKRTSDIQRSSEYSSDMRNASYRVSGAISKRKGFKINAQNPDNAYGVATFRKTNKDTGNIEDEFISINSNAHKLIDKNLHLYYNGNTELWYSLYLNEDSNGFSFDIQEQDNIRASINLGTGFNASDLNISQLAFMINELKFKVATAVPVNVDKVLSFANTDDNLPPGTSGAPNIPIQLENTTYTLHLLPEKIEDFTALYIDQYLQIEDEETYVQIQDIKEQKSGDKVVLYTLTLYGWSPILEAGITGPVEINQYLSISATYDNSVANYKAALLDPAQNQPILSDILGGTDLSCKIWSQIPNGDSSITSSFEWKTLENTNALLDQEIENCTFASLHNCLYVSNGYDYVSKYDGKYFYRAGLPVADKDLFTVLPINPTNTFESSSQGVKQYKFVLEYTDAVGNIISSQPSDVTTIDVTTNNVHIYWNPADMQEFLKGRDLSGEFDSDHSSYQFLDSLPSAGGSAYRPWNHVYNGVSSTLEYGDTKKYRGEKRLRIKVYRTKVYDPANGVPGQFYLIADVPYNVETSARTNTTGSVDSNLTYQVLDEINDSELNNFTALVEPIKRHDPPPKGKYLSVFKNCLVVSGQLKNVNNLQYSLPKNASTGEIGCEYFPEDSNGVIINSEFGDKITAIAPLRDLLYIFHNDSIHILGGQINLLEDPVVDLLTKEGGVGCTSQHSIEEFRNQLLFLSRSGIYVIDASNSLKELSSKINSLFNDKDLKFKRAATFNWTDENIIVTVIPKEDFSYIRDTATGISVLNPTDANRTEGTYTITSYSISRNRNYFSPRETVGIELELEIVIDANGTATATILSPGKDFTEGDIIYVPLSSVGNTGTGIYIEITSVTDKLNTIYTSPFEESLIVAYDYYRDAWLQWNNLDFTGGVAIYKDKVTFATRSENVSYLCTMSNTGTKYDYSDHNQAIPFYYETNWESLADPTIPKKFLRIKMYSMDTDETFESSSFELGAYFYKDYNPGNIGSIDFSFGGSGLGWGEAPWGLFPWGSVSSSILKHKLASNKCKSLKIRFTNENNNENVLITNYEYEIAAPYGTEIKD